MNTLEKRGKWNRIRGKMLQIYAGFSGSNRKFLLGKAATALGRLQQSTGRKTRKFNKMIHQTS